MERGRAEKPEGGSLEGLKPVGFRLFAPGLKPRPPKEEDFFSEVFVFISKVPASEGGCYKSSEELTFPVSSELALATAY